MKKLIFTAILLIGSAGLFLETDSARAQSIFLEPNTEGGIHLEALRPSFDNVNLNNTSFSFYLSARIEVGRDLQLRAELPYITFKEDDPRYYYDPYVGYYYYQSPGSGDSFGNPYLGLDFGKSNNGFQGEVGFRMPVAQDYNNALDLGMATDPVERLEAYVSDLLPLYFGANYRYKSKSGFGMRLRMVPVFWLYLNNTSNNSDNDVFVLYSAQAWYENEKVGVGGGFSGRYITTGHGHDFGDRSLHQFVFFGNYSFGKIMPGFQVRFPLDSDLKDNGMNPSFSLSIGVKL